MPTPTVPTVVVGVASKQQGSGIAVYHMLWLGHECTSADGVKSTVLVEGYVRAAALHSQIHSRRLKRGLYNQLNHSFLQSTAHILLRWQLQKPSLYCAGTPRPPVSSHFRLVRRCSSPVWTPRVSFTSYPGTAPLLPSGGPGSPTWARRHVTDPASCFRWLLAHHHMGRPVGSGRAPEIDCEARSQEIWVWTYPLSWFRMQGIRPRFISRAIRLCNQSGTHGRKLLGTLDRAR